MVYHRGIFAFINRAFNKVDVDRLSIVGADRLCAEWIIKNGGAIRFKDMGKLFNNYNNLPNEETKLKVREIYTSAESSIMSIGFEHLRDCNDVEKIILNNCDDISNDAIEKLLYVKNSLTHLEIVKCPRIDDKGLLKLQNLANLKKVILGDLKSVKTMGTVEETLKNALTKCEFLVNK